jgi:hypothetical protein
MSRPVWLSHVSQPRPRPGSPAFQLLALPPFLLRLLHERMPRLAAIVTRWIPVCQRKETRHGMSPSVGAHRGGDAHVGGGANLRGGIGVTWDGLFPISACQCHAPCPCPNPATDLQDARRVLSIFTAHVSIVTTCLISRGPRRDLRIPCSWSHVSCTYLVNVLVVVFELAQVHRA